MSERDRKIALGVAAGAAAVGAAGAAAVFGARNSKSQRGAVPEAEDPDEETSGRGQPAAGPDPESRESGYDLKDASVRSLVKVIVISLTLMVLSVAAVFAMFSRFDHAFQEPNGDLTAEQVAPIMPPLPHLQAEPYRDIDASLMQQTQRLTTYGWNGSDHTTAHIPIERAIQQVIGKPLDGSAQADAAGPKGADAPQPATPDDNADLPQEKPADRVQGEGNTFSAAPRVMQPPAETKP